MTRRGQAAIVRGTVTDPEPAAAEEAAPRFNYDEYFGQVAPRRLRRLPYLARTSLSIVWRAAPRHLVAVAVLQVVNAATLAAQLLVVRELLADLLQPEEVGSFGSLVPEMVLLAVISATGSVSALLLDAQQRVLAQLVTLHTAEQVIRTATGVDLETYESPTFHDRLQRAQVSAGSRPTQLANGLLGVASGVFAIGAIAATLLVVQPLFCLLLMVAFVPMWLATNRAGRMVYRFSVQQTERERRRWYLFGVLTRKLEAQEVRAFDLNGFLGTRHHDLYVSLIDDLRVLVRRRLRVALAGQLATAALTGGAIAFLVWFITSGRMSLSEAGTAAGAMILLSGRLRTFAHSAGSLYEGSLYLDDYSSFVAAAPRIEAARPTAAAPPDVHEVRAESVTFTYPSRNEPSLVDASLVLRRDEVVALVGENGSGKTTFAKLLAGLYRPQSGVVTWDGVDVAALEPSSARARVAVIFQDFIRYQLSAHDNIAMGDHRRFDDVAAVERAARAAGVHDAIAELDRGYESLLGPEYFGGSDFSGGQWQRIALARAFFRDAPIVILDEPTAALDPRAEAALYDNMRELFAGRGVVLISHRFGSVRNADRIYVLHEGRVTGSGTHDELMDAGGHYAELFRLQASRYLDGQRG